MLTDEPTVANLHHSYLGLLMSQIEMCRTKADSFILRTLSLWIVIFWREFWREWSVENSSPK
jgi:hypothetical protein